MKDRIKFILVKSVSASLIGLVALGAELKGDGTADVVGSKSGSAKPAAERLPSQTVAATEATIEWMIGQWEWVQKWKQGEAPPELQNLSALHVFPFVDYGRAPDTKGIYIAADFLVLDPSGGCQLLPTYPSVVVYAGNTLVYGVGVPSFRFRYSHESRDGKEWLRLTSMISETNRYFSILFEKTSADPGEPLDRKRLMEWVLGSDPDEETRKYQERMRLRRQRGAAGP